METKEDGEEGLGLHIVFSIYISILVLSCFGKLEDANSRLVEIINIMVLWATQGEKKKEINK